jgi:tetratricopeptide (TPR) repeat protein
MPCLDERTVLALVEGTLPDTTRREAEAHLDKCASCLALVAELARATGAEPRTRPRTGAIGGRYEIGPELARGGMGRIHEAYDRTLGRHVAIKCALHDAPALVQRFAREVALTSRLEHPAIVPIQDAGTLPDGTPFYAMRLVVGRTLDRLIAEAETPARRLALVPNVIAVADAMAYAHSHRVIHRDLKPHNILVGEFGETVLLDWGLAKDLAATEEPTPESAAAAQDAMSMHGEVIGTRGYMAPEQAAGEAVGVAADVYGLGATLFHVLTGLMPRGTLLEPTDDIPQDLVAIVARATAEDPASRYPSARELAADLHRFQAGRLVEAHRYTPAQLVARWIRRHRAAVGVATIAVAVLATVSVLGLHRIFAEHDAAVSARERAERQRDAAEDVVGFVVVDLRERLEQLGRLDLLSDTGTRIADYYELLGHVGYERAFGHHIDALQTLGEAQKASGKIDRAVQTFQQELALARESGEQDRVCWALVRVGQMQRAAGKVEESAKALRECADLARGARDRESRQWQQLLAASGIELAKLAYGRRDLTEARKLATEVNEIGHRLVAIDVEWGQRAIEQASSYLAQWDVELGEWADARRSAEESLAASRHYAARRPDDVTALRAVANALTVLGQIQAHDNDPGADASYAAARQLLTRLVAREPGDAALRRELSRLETELGRLASNRDDLRGALAHFQTSRDLIEEIVKDMPNSPDQVRDLAVSDADLADTLRQLGDIKAARTALRRSLDSFERVVELAPSEVAGISELAMALDSRAEFEVTTHGDVNAARADLVRAVELGRTVLAASDTPNARVTQARRLLSLVETNPPNPAKVIAEAVAVIAPVRAQAAADPQNKQFLAALDAASRRTH